MELDCCGSQAKPHFIQRISEGSLSPLLLNFYLHTFELRILAHSQVTPSLKGATSELEEAFFEAPMPVAEGAHAGKEGAVDRSSPLLIKINKLKQNKKKVSFAQGRPHQPIGISLWIQSQMISLQAKVMDPTCCHKLLLYTLHSPSCSKAVSVMFGIHCPVAPPNRPPFSLCEGNACLLCSGLVISHTILKLPH